MKNNIRLLIYTALMTALVFITTSIIKIPIPFSGGYIHAGDMCIFIAGILLGPVNGAIAAGVGSAMADFLGGYAQWVIPTLIVKSIMGLLIGYFAKPTTKTKPYLLGTMFIWIAAIMAFVYTLSRSSAELVMSLMETADIAEATAITERVRTQLMVVSIGMPVAALIFWRFKKSFDVSMNQLLSMIIAGIWMVFGYFIAEGIMYGSFVASIFSIPWNIVQFTVGGVLAFLVIKALDKAKINASTLL